MAVIKSLPATKSLSNQLKYLEKEGKTVEELVMDGMKNKMAVINDESQEKLQDTMQKVVNDSNGGMVCIII